ncbi:MAG: site-2 protease family protein [Actinobacteria bacterium]|nr:site-2 protease family protein [Actinomycetota bacterium]
MLRYLLATPPDIAGFIMVAVVFLIALSLHEFGHAAAATVQGDPTAKNAGRLTVNPKAHLDAVGTLMIVMVGFGWGKPVPFAPNKLRNQRFGSAGVAIAGPAVNFALAIITAAFFVRMLDTASDLTLEFLFLSLRLNVVLGVFNLMPIPPLDGSRLLSVFLPPSKQHIIYFLDRWGFVILLVFVFLLFPFFAAPIINTVVRFILNMVGGTF